MVLTKVGSFLEIVLPEKSREELGAELKQAKLEYEQAYEDALPYNQRLAQAKLKVLSIEAQIDHIRMHELHQREIENRRKWRESVKDTPVKRKEKPLPDIDLADFV